MRDSIPPKAMMIGSIVLFVPLYLLVVLSGFDASKGGNQPDEGRWLAPDERVEVELTSSLKTLDGRGLKLEDLKGKVLFVNFWATWCAPCRAEMPSIAALYEEVLDHGIEVVAITDEDPGVVKRFLYQNTYPFRILIDAETIMASQLRIWSIPWTLILDKKGKLVHFHPGARRWDTPEIVAKLRSLAEE